MLQFINPAAPMDTQFSFVDRGRVQRGDYYYIRVKQLDGSFAWSSAIPHW